jgi:hypothetical protein
MVCGGGWFILPVTALPLCHFAIFDLSFKEDPRLCAAHGLCGVQVVGTPAWLGVGGVCLLEKGGIRGVWCIFDLCAGEKGVCASYFDLCVMVCDCCLKTRLSSNGMISASQAGVPGSIPGGRIVGRGRGKRG